MARFLQYVLQYIMGGVLFRGVPGPRSAVVLLALCAALLAGCEEIEEEKPWIHVERPQMLFTDTTLLDCYDKDILSWKLKTAYLERWSDKEVVFMRPVLVDIYDSVGERVAFLRADSGRMDMKFTYVYAYGHVYALTPKGASVRADSLMWNKRDDKVHTDSYVRVVSEDGDVLQGKGFVSDARMDNWRILSNVTGIFQDAAKRMKEEDKKQAEELEKKPESAPAPVPHRPPTSAVQPAPAAQPLQNKAPAPAPNGAAKNAPSQGPNGKNIDKDVPGLEDPEELERRRQERKRRRALRREGKLDDDMLESSASEASQNEPASESRPRAKRRE